MPMTELPGNPQKQQVFVCVCLCVCVRPCVSVCLSPASHSHDELKILAANSRGVPNVWSRRVQKSRRWSDDQIKNWKRTKEKNNCPPRTKRQTSREANRTVLLRLTSRMKRGGKESLQRKRPGEKSLLPLLPLPMFPKVIHALPLSFSSRCLPPPLPQTPASPCSLRSWKAARSSAVAGLGTEG